MAGNPHRRPMPAQAYPGLKLDQPRKRRCYKRTRLIVIGGLDAFTLGAVLGSRIHTGHTYKGESDGNKETFHVFGGSPPFPGFINQLVKILFEYLQIDQKSVELLKDHFLKIP